MVDLHSSRIKILINYRSLLISTQPCSYTIEINCTFYVVHCPLNVDYGLLWKPAVANTVINIPCNKIHTSFRRRLYITRECLTDGTWMPADLSACTIHPDPTSLLMLSFLCSDGTINSGSSNIVFEMKVLVFYYVLTLCYYSLLHCR